MKRSEINHAIREADAFFRANGFRLPPFADWSPDDWSAKGDEVRDIVDCHLGWDITDFGQDDFARCGLTIFTIRNGKPENIRNRSGKMYCEKIIMLDEGQRCPLHYHHVKVEDIINRGGGTLVVELHQADEEGELSGEPMEVEVDGMRRVVGPGEKLRLGAGESITLRPGQYHALSTEGGRVMVGEVSLVSDDLGDNRFHEPVGRFPDVEEDEPPHRLLCEEYGQVWGK